MATYSKLGNRATWGCILFLPALFVVIFIGSCVAAEINPERNVGFAGAGIAIFLILVPFIAISLGLVLGLVWAPFGALVCSLVARRKGLERRRFAVAGALYSLFFFWPWVYLLLRMYDRSVPRFLVRGAYIMLYGAIWPFGSLIFFVVAGNSPTIWVIPVLLFVGSGITWIVSMRMLTSWLKNQEQTEQPPDVLPHRNYIVPFGLTFAWLLLGIVLQLIAERGVFL